MLRSNGSALVVALIALALASLMILASTTVASQMAADAVRAQQKDAVDKFSQFVEAIASNPDTCSGTGTMSGLTFVNPTTRAVGKDQFVLTAGGPPTQEVRLPSNFEVTPGVARIIKGVDANDSTKAVFDVFNRLTVDRFAIQTPRQLDPNTYQVELVQQSSVGNQTFAPRLLGNLTLAFTAGSLSSCILKQSAQAMCEDMGCRFNIAATKQKCVCGFTAMTCPQTAGQPMSYIAGVDTRTNPPTPICQTFKASCLTTKGPGYAISGIDSSGNPICEAVEGTVAGATPTPSPSPTASPTPSAFACTVMFPTMWDDGAGGDWFCDARARAPVGMNIGDTFSYTNTNGGHSRSSGLRCLPGMGTCDGQVDISCTAGGLVITSQTCVGP